MKIVQIVCTYPPYRGGIGNAAKNFAHFAEQLGKESAVIIPGVDSDYGELCGTDGVMVKKIKPFLRYGNGAFLPQLVFLLKEYDVVHLHFPFFGGAEPVFFAKLFYRKRFKLIIHYHMDTPSLSGPAAWLSVFSKVLAGKLFAMADKIIYASDDYLKQSSISDYFQKNPDKFFLMPYSVDSDKFFPLAEKNREKSILFVGGLDKAHYFKGIDILLPALKGVLHDSLKLVIVGQGDLRSEYEKKVQDLGMGAYVRFAGGVSDEDLAGYYQNASLFVLPSINSHEAFGIVLLEAMSAGVPVVASNLPGVRQVFTDGREGFLAEPGDGADLRSKILRIINDDDLHRQMSERARQLVLEKYGYHAQRKKLESLYEDILE